MRERTSRIGASSSKKSDEKRIHPPTSAGKVLSSRNRTLFAGHESLRHLSLRGSTVQVSNAQMDGVSGLLEPFGAVEFE
jgi:hypothetical protein